MQINISARHGHLSAGTQEKITEKVEGLRRFFDRMTALNVTVDLEHPEKPTVEVHVSAERHDELVASESADSVLAALDGVIEKIESQLRKSKEKLKDHRATPHKHIETPVPGESD